MNLPNYFLADLPPEATLTPQMITEACQTLKHNREQYLASRSTQGLVNLIAEVADNWLNDAYPFRKLALEQGPTATGFSRATLANGLDNFFKQLTAENLNALLVQDLGHAKRLDELAATSAEERLNRAAFALGPEFLVHIAAGNIPNPTLMSIVLGLLTRSAQFVKCASGDVVFAAAVRALALRRRPQARRVPGDRRVARRSGTVGAGAVRRGGLRHGHGQRRDAGGDSREAAGQGAFSRLRPSREFRLRGERGVVRLQREENCRSGRRRMWWRGINWAVFRRT